MHARQGIRPELGSGFIRHAVWDGHLHQETPWLSQQSFHIQ